MQKRGIRTIGDWNLNRRELMALVGAGAGMAILPRMAGAQTPDATPATVSRAPSLTIDISTEPATLDPALTYDANGWSIVHSVYDSLLQYNNDGELELLLAEEWEWKDPTTIAVKLRPGITFHNGEPLTSKAVQFSLEHLTAEETASQVAGNFKVIESFNEIDDLNFELVLSQPAPRLPAQIAAWLPILPPDYAATNDFARNPVGTGPYRFESWSPGEKIELSVNEEALGPLLALVPLKHRDFERAHNRIHFPRAMFDEPLPQADRHTLELCVAQCDLLMQRMEQRRGITAVVRSKLFRDSGRFPTLPEIAGELAMHPRTLRRHLAEEGTSFRELLNAARATVAADLLGNVGLTVEEVSKRLGYADVSTFSHAFKRWHGVAPSAYRPETRP